MLYLLREAWQRNCAGIDFVCRQPYTERWTSEVRWFRQDVLFQRSVLGSTLNLVDAAWRRLAQPAPAYTLQGTP